MWVDCTATSAPASIALASCADDGNARPTKAEFVRRACTIQVAGNRKLQAAGRAAKPGTSEKQFVEEQFVPIAEKSLIAPLDALKTPEGDDQQVDAIVAAARQAVESLKANPKAIRAQPGSAEDPFHRFAQLAAAYGLRCPS